MPYCLPKCLGYEAQHTDHGRTALVLAIPFGILADRWGRKPVILLGLVSFPLAAGWIATVCKSRIKECKIFGRHAESHT